MGHERGILSWQARRAALERRIERVEAQLRQPLAAPARERLRRERDDLLSRVRALGPSPQAKMG